MPRFQVGFRRTKLHACPLYWHQPARMHAAAGSSPVRLQALPPALSSARLLGAAGDLTPTTTANTGSGLSTGALLRALCLLRIWRLLSSCGMDRSARASGASLLLLIAGCSRGFTARRLSILRDIAQTIVRHARLLRPLSPAPERGGLHWPRSPAPLVPAYDAGLPCLAQSPDRRRHRR